MSHAIEPADKKEEFCYECFRYSKMTGQDEMCTTCKALRHKRRMVKVYEHCQCSNYDRERPNEPPD